MFARILQGRLPQHSFFLFGPRQVGKSTLLRELNTIFSLDLLDPEKQLMYIKTPNLFMQQVEALPHEGMILIDEIQRAPQLLDVIHLLIEKYPRLHFAMSGSSARKLRHGAANLLGGRALYRTMHPLTWSELGEHARLDWCLSYGSLPKIYTLLLEKQEVLAQEFLRSYVVTYLREEVKAEALVRNLQGFQNFLDVAAAQFAEQVNWTDVGRQCAVSSTTVREYYSILEDTWMGLFLYPLSRSERKRMSLSPKFYFFDNGVTRALLGALQGPPSPLEQGRLFEQWIVQEVHRMNLYQQMDLRLSFWRTSHGAEVDLVLQRGQRILCGIECKFKKSITKADFSGMYAFREVHADVPCYVVAPVDQPFRIDDVTVLPPAQLLDMVRAL